MTARRSGGRAVSSSPIPSRCRRSNARVIRRSVRRVRVALMMRAAAKEAWALSGGGCPIDVDTGPSALVRGSRDEFTSLFRDLTSDTVRHTPSGGLLSLRWRIEADGRGAFSANDPGIGIAAEHLPRLARRPTVLT